MCSCERNLGVLLRAKSAGALAGDECRSPEKMTCMVQRQNRLKNVKQMDVRSAASDRTCITTAHHDFSCTTAHHDVTRNNYFSNQCHIKSMLKRVDQKTKLVVTKIIIYFEKTFQQVD